MSLRRGLSERAVGVDLRQVVLAARHHQVMRGLAVAVPPQYSTERRSCLLPVAAEEPELVVAMVAMVD